MLTLKLDIKLYMNGNKFYIFILQAVQKVQKGLLFK